MKFKIFISILIAILVVGSLAGVKVLQVKKLMAAGQAMVTPPETISSAVVREEKWQGALSTIGSISAVQGVTVTPDIPGTVREIAFESGANVSKGDLLVRLDTSSEEAQLAAMVAQTELARLTLERVRKLRADNAVSPSELDTAEASLRQNQANADSIRATIAKKTIRAPFSGRLGIRLINLGQYLDAGKPIVSLQSLAPVFADFSLPQQEIARLKTGLKVRLSTDAYPGRQFEGLLTAINPELDQSTRSISLQATLDNQDQLLRPGMFARLDVVLPEEQCVLAIPSTAVLSAPYGDSVFVVEPKSGKNGSTSELVARQQIIRTGRTRGDFVSVESGLKAGERIVSAGQFKLHMGMSVVENNSLAPKAEEKPNPPDI